MLEELIIFVQQGVVCDLTREREARFGEWSIFTQNMATFWRFCGGESDSSFQGVNILISKWQILTGRSLKPNKKLSFFFPWTYSFIQKQLIEGMPRAMHVAWGYGSEQNGLTYLPCGVSILDGERHTINK